jgi:SAM-dependent methyltransferase
MRSDLLVCPGCRTRTGDRIDVRTLEQVGEVLACECGRRYPIIDGVPIVLADPGSYLRRELATVVERELSPEVAATLVEHGEDDAPYARLLEHLSIYLDSHWGDRAVPGPDGPGAGLGVAALVGRIARLAHVPLAVELGCSAGRIVAELATRADHVIGVDLHFGALRRARRLLAGEPLAYSRRMIGRHYLAATIPPGEPARGTALVCGDALDPPLVPLSFDRVVAVNLLDSVSQPRQLLSVMDGLCATGGELILASPYAWQSAVLADDARIGGADPASELTAILRDGTGLGSRYDVEDEAELSWTLRRDARSALTYRIHYVRARKR